MKFKKILSSVLVAIMLFTSVAAVIPPVTAEAAYVNYGDTTVSADATAGIIKTLLTKNFATAEEMFNYDLENKYLVGVALPDGSYELYVNKYTGYVYYINGLTGEMLMSNPYNFSGATSDDVKQKLSSQLIVEFTDILTGKITPYTSTKWAAMLSQINVLPISNGFRVNYSIGDTSDRFLLPVGMDAVRYEEKILDTLLKQFIAQFVESMDMLDEDTLANCDVFILKDENGDVVYDEDGNAVLAKPYEMTAVLPDDGGKKTKVYYLKKPYIAFTDTSEDGVPYYKGDLIYNGESLDTDGDGVVSEEEMIYFYDYETLKAYAEEFNDLFMLYLKTNKDTKNDVEYNKVKDIFQAFNFFSTIHYELKNPYEIIASYNNYKEKYETATTTKPKENAQKNMQREYNNLKKMFTEFPVTGSFDENGNPVAGTPIYVLNGNSTTEPFEKTQPTKARTLSNHLKNYYPTYSLTEMIQDEKDAGCVMPVTAKPIFRCSIEYTLDKEGTLRISIPSNSIMFDETKYTLKSISVLPSMGAASYVKYDKNASVTAVDNEESYAFFPDGSGMVVNFAEHKNATLNRPLYGTDYAYSTLQADVNYLESATMPVFGIVTEKQANDSTKNILVVNSTYDGMSIADKVELLATVETNLSAAKKKDLIEGKTELTAQQVEKIKKVILESTDLELKTGFVAVIEEGSALANVHIDAGGTSHKYGTSYISISPYPQDTFDLSTSITVGDSASSYVKVADSKYTGSYVMKVNILSDSVCQALVEARNQGNAQNEPDYNTYAASYVGMAACYREYLVATGVFGELVDASREMPLYIEALGSMDYIKKILTIPVNSSKELTRFEDIATMYSELSNAVKTLNDKSAEYTRLAGETEDIDQKVNYENKAKEFAALAVEFKDLAITNINFKLTGFANEGLSYQYPTKLKWERACGGKNGFSELTTLAAEKNFGVYPDFDFMYMVNSAMFDGVGTNGYISRHIDNRYAAKQTYDPTSGMYFPGFESVISTKVLSVLFDKFESRYAKYDWKYISLSTFGTTLNSDFDEDEPTNRDQSMKYVTDVLAGANDKGYSVMVDGGNAYTYEYVDHIVNLAIDSSHLSYCSYTVPFVGMVLHGYVNYAGNPINYSGDDDYDILRSIENGASLLYILCYSNTEFMKENMVANKYYSVDYEHWYTNILANYKKLDDAIGDLQDYTIIDHKEMIAEKFINNAQAQQNLINVYNEYIELVSLYLNFKIDEAYQEMKLDKIEGIGVDISVDVSLFEATFEDLVNMDVDFDELAANDDSLPTLAELVEQVKVLRGHKDGGKKVEFDSEEHMADFEGYYTENSKYDYYTDSYATDGSDYDETVYTAVNHNVFMVTYAKTLADKSVHKVSFLLNFNIYAVDVRLDDGTVVTLDRYEFKPV